MDGGMQEWMEPLAAGSFVTCLMTSLTVRAKQMIVHRYAYK